MKQNFIVFVIALVLFAAGFTPSAKAAYTFSSNLSLGGRQSAAEVLELQKFLTAQGLYTGPLTGGFYNLTYKAVIAFQQREGIVPASGFFGPLTRERANALGAGTVAGVSTTTTSAVSTTNDIGWLKTRLADLQRQLATLQKKYRGSTASATTTPSTGTTSSTSGSTNTQSGSGGTSSPVTPSSSGGNLEWGVYAGADGVNGLAKVESMVGQQADMQAIFWPWGEAFPSEYKATTCKQGKTLVIFWENYGYSLDNIIDGKYDSYIKSFSSGIQSYGCPVVISLFHEMNGNWDDWDGTVGNNTPAKVVAAWKHTHDLVTASNAKWAWAVNNESVPNRAGNQFSDYWPGSSYVDYVGIDGFNFGSPWRSFSDLFGPAITTLKGYGKPIYIYSMGSAAGSQKAAWITDAIAVQMPKYGIKGFVWFNENKEQNWLINSDTASLAAFKAAISI